ncbi:hypothetical protein B9Z55_026016 [Caenorhabditis nigoni]|uniref:Uncharacterized protein n=1 Tax=Caenorhabditis nigoni TaxID=1611254 RepID=A0A2G5T187_9PELO|nr:hypothetical protein B9Z55_026016 [Caenorhabditis nigoni]
MDADCVYERLKVTFVEISWFFKEDADDEDTISSTTAFNISFSLGAAVWTIAKAQNGSRDCEHYCRKIEFGNRYQRSRARASESVPVDRP